MAFQIKDFASITASAINWMRATTRKVTDYNVGSVARTLVEAPAAEIEQLYLQAFNGLKEAIPVSVYNSFSFDRLPAAPAAGIVRVTVTVSALVRLISAGTAFNNPGKRDTYLSISDISIPATASFVDVPVVCGAQGALGNIAALQVFTVTPVPDGFVSAINPAAFVSGVFQETDEERRLRFNAFIASLNRGTLAALDYGAKLTTLFDAGGNVAERVAAAAIVEPYLTDVSQPVALVKVYVHNGTGGTSLPLVARCQKIIDGYVETNGSKVPGWKAAGVVVEVLAAAEQLVNVTATVWALPGFRAVDLVPQVTAAVTDYIRGLQIGDTAIRSEVISRGMDVDGVYNFIVTAPPIDITSASNVKLLPGVLNVAASGVL